MLKVSALEAFADTGVYDSLEQRYHLAVEALSVHLMVR